MVQFKYVDDDPCVIKREGKRKLEVSHNDMEVEESVDEPT